MLNKTDEAIIDVWVMTTLFPRLYRISIHQSQPPVPRPSPLRARVWGETVISRTSAAPAAIQLVLTAGL